MSDANLRFSQVLPADGGRRAAKASLPACPVCGLPPDGAGPSGYICKNNHTWPRSNGQAQDRETAEELKRHAAARLAQKAAPTPAEPARPGLRIVSARDLLTREWPEPPWVVPGLLPVGLTLLAGKPKVGKSWLALQLVQAVACGGRFLDVPVEQAPCLYLALEDSPRRLATRMKAQGWERLDAVADFVTVGEARDVLPLNGKTAGAVALGDAIRERGYKLVVIDTLSRAVSGDQNAVDVMTAALTPLQEAAHEHNCAVLVLDHHNKMGAANPYGGGPGMEVQPDPVLNILGSTGKAAMADAIWGLYKAQGKAGAVLAVVGRDVEEKQLLLKHDPLTKCWQSEGDAEAVRVSDARRVVWDSVKELGETTCTELAEILGRNKGSVLKDLVKLVGDGLLFRDGNTFRATQEERVSTEQKEKCGNFGNPATLATMQPGNPTAGHEGCQVAKVARVARAEEETPGEETEKCGNIGNMETLVTQ